MRMKSLDVYYAIIVPFSLFSLIVPCFALVSRNISTLPTKQPTSLFRPKPSSLLPHSNLFANHHHHSWKKGDREKYEELRRIILVRKSAIDGDIIITPNKQREELKSSPRRQPRNGRIAIRWVVDSVEKVLKKEQKSGSTRSKVKTTNNARHNVLLLEALTKLYTAKNQNEIIDAGDAIGSLNVHHHGLFSHAVQERVMKATAMAGLVDLSLQILHSMIKSEGHGERSTDDVYIPSVMAYVAVLNSLRKLGEIDQMRATLVDLSIACSLVSSRVDIVAVNTFLAALCDRAIRINGESSASSRRKRSPVNTKPTIDFRANDLLVEAVDLIRSDRSSKEFSTNEYPNSLSFNTVLNAVARVGNRTLFDEVFELMQLQDIDGDIYTYNARLRAAILKKGDYDTTETMTLIDEILSSPTMSPDQYTIELAIVPLARAGRIGDILNLLRDFNIQMGDKQNKRILSNAYSTFLISLVKGGEVSIARAIFDTFILPPSTERTCTLNAKMESSKASPMKDENEDDFSTIRPSPITRHFNALIEGYRTMAGQPESTRRKLVGESSSYKASNERKHALPSEEAVFLFDLMTAMKIRPDSFTITLMMGFQDSSREVTILWQRAITDFNIRMTPIIYHSIITAYGRTQDPSSACYAFDHMLGQHGLSNSINSWNVLLSVLSKTSSRVPDTTLTPNTSSAATMSVKFDRTQMKKSKVLPGNKSVADIVDGLTCAEAAKEIFNFITISNESLKTSTKWTLYPNSQTYCFVASALSHGISDGASAVNLFRDAMKRGVPADGRFMNGIIRCFGNDIESAIAAWKSDFRGATLAFENRKRSPNSQHKKGKNLIAAYHGLFHVAGRAGRPDIALRLAYAMTKEGLEPSETTMNCYYKGKKTSDLAKGNEDVRSIRMMDQYESLLTIECTKYDKNDRRRLSERRVRIII